MGMVELRFAVPEDDLLDLAEDVGRLLERTLDDDLSQPLRGLLFAVDDAITDAFCGEANALVAAPRSSSSPPR